jgi:hypothetical protein
MFKIDRSLISISWLLESVCLCPKVILLVSGVHCTINIPLFSISFFNLSIANMFYLRKLLNIEKSFQISANCWSTFSSLEVTLLMSDRTARERELMRVYSTDWSTVFWPKLGKVKMSDKNVKLFDTLLVKMRKSLSFQLTVCCS